MDVDPDIANWVLEFLLRQPLDGGTLQSLLRILPLRNDDTKLKKLLLLKKLESVVASDSISEDTLELLEQLAEIELQNENEISSVAMRRAYCAVAVESTAKNMTKEDIKDDLRKFRYFETVKRVWKGKIGRIKEAMVKWGLGSDELWAWKDEIEAAVWDDSVLEAVVEKSMGVNAAGAIENYVRQERGKMGPSFLERLAARMKDDEFRQGMMTGEGSVDRVAEKDHCCQDVGLSEHDKNDNESEIQKGKIHLRNKVAGLKNSRGRALRNSRRANIVDSDESNFPPSEEVDRVRKILRSRSLELQAVVKDPLPEAIQFAKSISNGAREDQQHNPTEENCAEANNVDGAGVDQPISEDERRENGHDDDPGDKNYDETNSANGAGFDQAIGGNVSNVSRPNLMERNHSPQTFEWNDSIDTSQDDPTERHRRLILRSPEVINASPLKIYKNNSFKRRRQPRKWSPQEEDALRAGVQQFGRGNWKVILNAYRDKFEDRTDGDLKDKWRNMTRST